MARGRWPRVPKEHIRRPRRTLTPLHHDTSALCLVVSRTEVASVKEIALRLLSRSRRNFYD